MGNPSVFLRSERTSCDTCAYIEGRDRDERGHPFATCSKLTNWMQPRFYAIKTGCRHWDPAPKIALPVVDFPRWRAA
jgi:hypothetical protein